MLGHGRTFCNLLNCLGRAHGPAVSLLYAVALLILFAAFGSAWGACVTVNERVNIYVTEMFTSEQPSGTGIYCATGPACPSVYRNCLEGDKCATEPIQIGSYYYSDCTPCGEASSGCTTYARNGRLTRTCRTRCDNSCDAQKAECQLQGGIWIDSVGYGECDGYCQKIDTTLCDPYRQQCERTGGIFSGSSNTGCCIATCNQCDSLTKLIDLKQQVCCDQGLAPPDTARMCFVLPQSECGMGWSQIKTNDYEFKCQSPSADSSASRRYAEQCFASSSSEAGSSSSEGSSSSSDWGSSSSGGGGSSSGQGGDCEECPWLDSILDTLHSIHGTIDNLYYCMITPGLCWEDQAFQFDTAWLRYIRPFLDTSLALDSAQLRELVSLDTNILRQLRQNEDDMERVVRAGVSTLDSTTDALNDTTRKWFRRIADSIGVSTDSLAAHIDSIIRHIPDTILDSIAKYQRYASDNFDSILYGKGKGFSLVDSLIDSAVKYFKDSHHYDSVYRKLFADSTSKLITAVDGLPGQIAGWIDENMGYGDTASTNLRGDLNGIKGGLDSLLSLLGDTSGTGEGGGGSGDGEGWGDSINAYMYTDDDYDAAYDSLEKAWGVDSLESSWDSSYAYGLCNGDDCPPCTDDSCMGRITGDLVAYGDSVAGELGQRLKDNVDSQEAALPTFWDSTFKELKENSWFGKFDSTFLANIGAKIPNTNTCPEHCFRQEVNGTYAYVGYNMNLDWKLCAPVAPSVLNGLNAFDLLKLIARILTVVTCLSIIMWEVSSRRGGGIGL